jgi:biotin synthase
LEKGLSTGISRDEAKDVLLWPQGDILSLVSSAAHLKRAIWGDVFSFCSIINAKSGFCDAGCIFCAQAHPEKTGAPVHSLVPTEKILAGARHAQSLGASRYSIVTSGRRPTDKEIESIIRTVKSIRQERDIQVDVSLGTLTTHHLKALKETGVSGIHHNLETSKRFYPRITKKIQWENKRTFLLEAKEMGFYVCSGALFGVGESDLDRIDLAFTLKEMGVASVPLNFLIPISGTPLEGKKTLNAIHCLRIIALYRFVMPQVEIRICGGREANLRDLQALAALMANGFMVGGYLTKGGRDPSLDKQLIKEDLGLTLV